MNLTGVKLLCSSSMSLNVLLSPFKLIRVVMADFRLVLGCIDIQMDRWACCWCLFSGVVVFVVGVAYILQVVDTSTLLCHLRGFFFLISLICDVANRLFLISIISS